MRTYLKIVLSLAIFSLLGQTLLAEECRCSKVVQSGSLQEYLDREITVKGRYVSESYIPDASSAGVWIPGQDPIPHITARIVLSDAGEVRLGPPMQKTSLRTPEEAGKFSEKSVVVKGKLQRFVDPASQEVIFWLQPTEITES